jgi:hypothetical protein
MPIPGLPVVGLAPATPLLVTTYESPTSPAYSPAYNPVARELDVADYDSELMEVTVIS